MEKLDSTISFGPQGSTWRGGKEKAPAAMCRKVAEANTEIEVWGNGLQTKIFYVCR